MEILIIGARKDGGLAAVLDILKQNDLRVLGLIDDNMRKGSEILGHRVLGGTDDLSGFKGKPFVANIGDNCSRRRIFDLCFAQGLVPITVIHKTAILGDTVSLGDGCLVHANATLLSGTKVGKGVVVNCAASINHDNSIGDYVNIGPGAHLAGRVVVEDGVFIGTGAVVIPDMVLERDSVIGAGTVVIQNVPRAKTVVGSPGRVL